MVKKFRLEAQNSRPQKFFSIQNVKKKAREYLFLYYLVIGSEELGVHDLLFNSIRKSDLDLRKTLYNNIVLSGGSTLVRGIEIYKI